ncbi:hypothetical protein HDV04_001546 [Boothiomyces sp. JEL0838]|nr:hypothetical protein HDV04_001546 [Boothiomyces sp. JEL0838]
MSLANLLSIKQQLELQKRSIQFICAAVSLVVVVVFTGVFSNSIWFSSTTTSFINRDPIHPQVTLPTFNGIAIYCNTTTLTRSSFNFRLHLDFKPKGKFLRGTNINPLLSQDILLTVDSKEIFFNGGQMMAARDFDLPLQTGNPNAYPFDSYDTTFYLDASTSVTGDGLQFDVPLSISITNSMDEWRTDFILEDSSPSKNDTSIKVSITFTRGISQKFFSLFIVVLMWVMSMGNYLIDLGVFLMAMSHVWLQQKIEAPTTGVVTSMLFALPAVRNMQPGQPPIGCTADVVGFFWNMSLVAAAALILLYRYSKQQRGAVVFLKFDDEPSVVDIKSTDFKMSDPSSSGVQKTQTTETRPERSHSIPKPYLNDTKNNDGEEIALLNIERK